MTEFFRISTVNFKIFSSHLSSFPKLYLLFYDFSQKSVLCSDSFLVCWIFTPSIPSIVLPTISRTISRRINCLVVSQLRKWIQERRLRIYSIGIVQLLYSNECQQEEVSQCSQTMKLQRTYDANIFNERIFGKSDHRPSFFFALSDVKNQLN